MKLRKRIAALGASLVLAVSMMSISASAASWFASHVNLPGMPSNTGAKAYVVVYHRAKGAKATCNYNTHTNAGATTGYTTIECITYYMSSKTIPNLGYKNCNPSVGSPNTDIYVQYYVTAYTPTYNDEFQSKGNIVKIS